jgi:RNA polymerase sigma-32 factor
MAKKKTDLEQKTIKVKPNKRIKNNNESATKIVTAELVDDNIDTSMNLESDDSFDTELLPEQSSHKVPALVATHTTKALTTTDPLTLYLASIRKYPLITREQEHKLALKYYEGKDPEAAQALVTSNLRFVVKVAAEYSKFGAKLIDLIQEGNIGLMHAVREFNPYRGVRLITYAVWWIRGYIQEYLMKQYSLVRIGTTQTQRKLFYQLQKEKKHLEALGENPDYSELSAKLGISIEEIEQMRNRLSGRDISLDKPLDDSTKATLGDLQKSSETRALDEDLALKEYLEVLKEKLEEIRPELSDRERIILDERLLSDAPLTLQEIGAKYGITREAVRQMETRVLKKIKTKFFAATGETDHNEN